MVTRWLVDGFRTRPLDVYVSAASDAHREVVAQVGAEISKLGRRHLRRGRLRVHLESSPPDDSTGLEGSRSIARSARSFVFIATTGTRTASQPNLVLQDWLSVNTPDRLYVIDGDRPDQLPDRGVLADIAAKAGAPLRSFDFASVFDAGTTTDDEGELRPIVGVLIAALLNVDRRLISRGTGKAILRVMRRGARCEEHFDVGRLSETLRFYDVADRVVRLPEIHAAITALGSNPREYLADLLDKEATFLGDHLAPKARAELAKARTSAYRESLLRSRPERPAFAFATGVAGLSAGVFAVFLSAWLAWALVSTQGVWAWTTTALAAVTLALYVGAVALNELAGDAELHRQRAMVAAFARAAPTLVSSLGRYLEIDVLLPYVRLRLNQGFPEGRLVPLEALDEAALSTQVLDRFRLETPAYRAVNARVAMAGGGALGLAGPRGAGKTTILNGVCTTTSLNRPDNYGSQVGLVIPAPVTYKSNEFISQTLASLCRTVVDAAQDRASGLGPYRHTTVSRSGARIAGAVITAASAVALLVLNEVWEPSKEQLVTYGPFALLLFGLWVAAGLTGVLRRAWRGRLYRPSSQEVRGVARSVRRRSQDAVEAAAAILNWLHFREEHSVDGGLSVRMPLSVEGTANRKLLFEGRPMTVPDLVSQFRSFVSLLTASGYRVFIGIDELDKIESDDDALALVNDLKALFGLPECYFLVSLSMSALAKYERRGLPFQHAFESAFDDVMHVDGLASRETVDLVQRRLLGVSRESALACHVLGGGLPRDVMRTMRELVQLLRSEPEMTQRTVVVEDVRRRLTGVTVQFQVDGVGMPEALRRLVDATTGAYEGDGWRRAAKAVRLTAEAMPADGSEPDDAGLAGIAAYVEWAVAVVSYLEGLDSLTEDIVFDIANRLAEARLLLSHDVNRAQTLVDGVCDQLSPVGVL